MHVNVVVYAAMCIVLLQFNHQVGESHWRGLVARRVGCRTSDQQVEGSTPGAVTIAHINVLLSSSSIISTSQPLRDWEGNRRS